MSTLRRFFLSRPPEGDTAWLEGDEAHHAAHVIRLKPADEAVLFDGSGAEYHARAERVTRSRVQFRILQARRGGPVSPTHLIVACSVVKPKAMDSLVQKCTELGVSEFWPCLSARTSIKVTPGDELKAAKWRRTALEAAKQCGRNRLPTVEAPAPLEEVLQRGAAIPLKLMLSTSGAGRPLRELLPRPAPERLIVLIGPEGGWTPQEEELTEREGLQAVSLGLLTLRAETAAIATAAAILVFYA